MNTTNTYNELRKQSAEKIKELKMLAADTDRFKQLSIDIQGIWVALAKMEKAIGVFYGPYGNYKNRLSA